MAIMLVLFIILCAIISVDFHQNNLIQPEKGTKLIYLSKNVSYLFIFLFPDPHLLIPYSDIRFFFRRFCLKWTLTSTKTICFYELSYIPGKKAEMSFFMAILFRPFSLVFVQLFL